MLVALAERTPLLAAAAEQVCFLDVDDTIRATYGYAKQGAGYGYSKFKDLNALLATLSAPDTAPVSAAATRAGARCSVTARMDPAGSLSQAVRSPIVPSGCRCCESAGCRRPGLFLHVYARSEASSRSMPMICATRSRSTSYDSKAARRRQATAAIMQSIIPRGVIPARRHCR